MTHRRGTTHHRRKVSWFLPLPATRTSGSFTSLTASLIAVSIYWCVSVLATLINKWLLSASEFKFPFPHTIALLQLIYAIVLLTVLKRLQIWSSPTAQWNSGAITMRRLWPLAATYALMLTANNMALKYLCLASYQMVRCASVGFVLVFTPFVLNREALPLNIVAAVLSILSGSIVWMSETVFTGIGLLYALVTSVSIALYSLYARQILYTFDYPVIYVYYRCIIIAVMLIAMVVVTSGELVGVFNTYFIGSPGFWLITGILATTGLVTAISLLLVLQTTNPIISATASIVKLFLQNFLVAFLFGNPIEWTHYVGFLIAIGGFILSLYGQRHERPKSG